MKIDPEMMIDGDRIARMLRKKTMEEWAQEYIAAQRDPMNPPRSYNKRGRQGICTEEEGANLMERLHFPRLRQPGDCSQEEFITLAHDMLNTWVNDTFNSIVPGNGTPPKPGNGAPPKYIRSQEQPSIDIASCSMTMNLSQNPALAPAYCDGSPLVDRSDEVDLWHATKDAYLPLICRDGMKGSPKSHAVIGGWFLSEEKRDWLFKWGQCPFSTFVGCYLHVRAPTDTLRENRRIGRGRGVVQTCFQRSLLRVRLVAVTFLLPSSSMMAWRKRFRTAVEQTIEVAFPHLKERSGKKKTFKELWGLIEHRCANMQFGISLQWTGCWTKVKTAVIHISAEVAKVIRALTVSNLEKKAMHIRGCSWNRLPPLQKFFTSEYGEALRRFLAEGDDPHLKPETLWEAPSTERTADLTSPTRRVGWRHMAP